MKLYVGAKAFIVLDGKILIVREAPYDEGTNLGKWDVPGGRIEHDEPILDGLRREVFEEVGLTVTVGEVLGIVETFPVIKGEQCHIVRVLFRATPHTSEVTLSRDHDMYEWFDPHTKEDKDFVSGIGDVFFKAL